MKHFTDWEEFRDTKLCHAWVATAIIGAGAIGAAATAYSANTAAGVQRDAANQAADINRQQLQFTKDVNTQNQTNLAPFRQAGTTAIDKINANPAFDTIDKFTPPSNQAELEATPGYQFTRTQGLKAVQNSAAARGLGVSGAALKGAATFATGLADQTYQSNYDRALGTFTANLGSKSAAFNRLSTLVNAGEAAAAGAATSGNQSAAIGTTGANNVGSNIISGSNATAAGINAAGGAASGFANNVAGYAAYKGLYGAPSGTTANPAYGVPSGGFGAYQS